MWYYIDSDFYTYVDWLNNCSWNSFDLATYDPSLLFWVCGIRLKKSLNCNVKSIEYFGHNISLRLTIRGNLVIPLNSIMWIIYVKGWKSHIYGDALYNWFSYILCFIVSYILHILISFNILLEVFNKMCIKKWLIEVSLLFYLKILGRKR